MGRASAAPPGEGEFSLQSGCYPILMTTLSFLRFPDPSCAPGTGLVSGAPASSPASFRAGAYCVQDTLAQRAFLFLKQSNSSVPQDLCACYPLSVQNADSSHLFTTGSLSYRSPAKLLCSWWISLTLYPVLIYSALFSLQLPDHSLKFLFSCLLSVPHELERSSRSVRTGIFLVFFSTRS